MLIWDRNFEKYFIEGYPTVAKMFFHKHQTIQLQVTVWLKKKYEDGRCVSEFFYITENNSMIKEKRSFLQS